MHFSLAKNLNRKGTGSALGFAALAQTGIAIAVLLSLAFVSTEAARTPSVALILIACLLLANAGLIGLYLRLRRIRESSRRMRLLADMNVQVNREILLNENIELIYRTILDYLFGTAVKSDKVWPEKYGVQGDYVPNGFFKQLKFPFVWKG